MEHGEKQVEANAGHVEETIPGCCSSSWWTTASGQRHSASTFTQTDKMSTVPKVGGVCMKLLVGGDVLRVLKHRPCAPVSVRR